MNYGPRLFLLKGKKRPSKVKGSLEGAVPRGIAPHEESGNTLKT